MSSAKPRASARRRGPYFRCSWWAPNRVRSSARPESTFDRLAGAPAPATDDHPFPYLRTPSIPGFYVLAIALILGLSIVAVRLAGGPLQSMVPYLDLLCMGAAFLLLETKNVVQFALLFGTTWLVNAFVFAGVLLSVLLAVTVSKRVRIRRTGMLYAALLATIAVNWLVPGRLLLDLPVALRLVAAVALAFTPIFLANLVFAERFRDTAKATAAFGANLLGAMLGGLAEYLALIVGYRHLLLVVAALYAAAFLLRPSRRPAAPIEPDVAHATTSASARGRVGRERLAVAGNTRIGVRGTSRRTCG